MSITVAHAVERACAALAALEVHGVDTYPVPGCLGDALKVTGMAAVNRLAAAADRDLLRGCYDRSLVPVEQRPHVEAALAAIKAQLDADVAELRAVTPPPAPAPAPAWCPNKARQQMRAAMAKVVNAGPRAVVAAMREALREYGNGNPLSAITYQQPYSPRYVHKMAVNAWKSGRGACDVYVDGILCGYLDVDMLLFFFNEKQGKGWHRDNHIPPPVNAWMRRGGK